MKQSVIGQLQCWFLGKRLIEDDEMAGTQLVSNYAPLSKWVQRDGEPSVGYVAGVNK